MRVRLLLAEDEWLIADQIERALTGSRYEIVAKAASLIDALRLADMARFDAAVLDGNLGGTKTWALARKLQCAGTPFLLLTAELSTDHPRLAKSIPALAKPFAAETLLAALDLLITDHKNLN